MEALKIQLKNKEKRLKRKKKKQKKKKQRKHKKKAEAQNIAENPPIQRREDLGWKLYNHSGLQTEQAAKQSSIKCEKNIQRAFLPGPDRRHNKLLL